MPQVTVPDWAIEQLIEFADERIDEGAAEEILTSLITEGEVRLDNNARNLIMDVDWAILLSEVNKYIVEC
jgi:hypothetical protein